MKYRTKTGNELKVLAGGKMGMGAYEAVVPAWVIFWAPWLFWYC